MIICLGSEKQKQKTKQKQNKVQPKQNETNPQKKKKPTKTYTRICGNNSYISIENCLMPYKLLK